MSATREINLLDFCAAIVRRITSLCKGVGCMLGHMLRLSYRYWWLVLTVMALAMVAALYYSRPTNRIYRVNAMAVLNGAPRDVVASAFQALAETDGRFALQNLSTTLGVSATLADQCYGFRVYDVFDCMNDGTADIVDYDAECALQDTLCVRMQDRLALQFYTKQPDSVLNMQKAILNYLNAQPLILSSYLSFHNNLMREVQFNHNQLEKLDSLTSHFYFTSLHRQLSLDESSVVMGTNKVELFLEDIREHMEQLSRTDVRLAYAKAPVVLSMPFTLERVPLNSPLKCLLLALLMGWTFGVVLAWLIERRSRIQEWLKA